MAFTKIESTDLIDKGVIGLPDTPGLSTAAMQAKLEETARGVIIPKHNDLIDELQAVDSASSLGANPPTGRTVVSPTVQGGLNKLSDDLKVVEDGMAQAIAESHSHPNKALLDTYTQTETDLADAVANKHAHSNKALLDTYTQTESDLADAVAQKHGHTNKALLDTYTQTDSDIADAIAQKHGHTNKAVIDKFGEDSGGNPTYDGNPIGGGGSGDTFKTIVSGGQSFVASGEDTFKINAGSNVTITPLSSPDKGIQISATGGGQSTGDMLMTDYDSQGNVKTAGGIDAYVGNEIGKLDVADSAVTGQYVSAVSETDGKISVTRDNLPTKVSDLTNDSGYQTASDVSTAIAGKADTSSLGDLAYINKDGQSSTKVLQGDGTWVTPSTGGHTMLPTPDASVDETAIVSAIKAGLLEGGTNDDVPSLNTIGIWSNCDAIEILGDANQGDDGVGTWNADNVWETDGVRTGWLWSKSLYQVLKHTVNGVLVDNDDVEIHPIFSINESEAVGLASYRIDDDYPQTISGVTVNGGCVAFKFTGAIKSTTVKVGLKLVHQRTNVEYVTPLS